jgi:hypothetical protein
MSATIQKRYEYKVSRNGTFLGILQNVKSDFGYNQQINSAGAQLNIAVAKSPDSASTAVSAILDETGAEVLDQVGGTVLEERAPELIGDGADNILIRNDNDIEVWEFSSRNVNGKKVFVGYISAWEAVYGADEDILVTVLSHGQDLSHYLTPGGTADTVDQSQTTIDDSFGSWRSYFGALGQLFGQTFTVGVGITNISAIAVFIGVGQNPSDSGEIQLQLWASPSDRINGIAALASVTKTITGNTTTEQLFTFPTPVTVVSGQTYFFSVDPDPSSVFSNINTWLGIDTKYPGNYSGGTIYNTQSGGTFLYADYDNGDFWFKTYYSHYTTEKTYSNSDPSTTLTSLMDYYISSGGDIAKPSAGYSLTGINPASTVFKVNTILEAIQKLFDLGPSDWYWYVDPADEILYYKQALTTADHTMIKGRHIQQLNLKATKEEIANVVYFTGGPTAGVNLFVQVNDTTSLLANRRGMVRLSDNRVTDTTVGQLIANNYIDQHDDQAYYTKLIINEAAYDISLFKLGQMIGFAGFGTFVDNLLLQVVGIQRAVDNVTLSLGTLPPRQTELSEQLRRELTEAQTIDNPTTPS